MAGIFKARKPGRTFFCAVVVFLVLNRTRGQETYLALIGPPPLRFESAMTNDPAFTEELTLPKPKDMTFSVSMLPTNSPDATEPGAAAGVSKSPLKDKSLPGILNPAARNAKRPGNPANNLLSTMPQMINQYFKPNLGPADDANAYQPGDTIFAPAELQFVPPLPGQSRAIYRIR